MAQLQRYMMFGGNGGTLHHLTLSPPHHFLTQRLTLILHHTILSQVGQVGPWDMGTQGGGTQSGGAQAGEGSGMKYIAHTNTA